MSLRVEHDENGRLILDLDFELDQILAAVNNGAAPVAAGGGGGGGNNVVVPHREDLRQLAQTFLDNHHGRLPNGVFYFRHCGSDGRTRRYYYKGRVIHYECEHVGCGRRTGGALLKEKHLLISRAFGDLLDIIGCL